MHLKLSNLISSVSFKIATYSVSHIPPHRSVRYSRFSVSRAPSVSPIFLQIYVYNLWLRLPIAIFGQISARHPVVFPKHTTPTYSVNNNPVNISNLESHSGTFSRSWNQFISSDPMTRSTVLEHSAKRTLGRHKRKQKQKKINETRRKFASM